MLQDDFIAAFLALDLALVLIRAIYESIKSRQGKKATPLEGMEPEENQFILLLSAVFVVIFYFEMASYPMLVLLGLQNVLTGSYVQLRFPLDSLVQAIGIAMMVFGYVLVFWGLHALEYDKLVTRGPYRYVRHPQYLGYFIVFAGFFLLLLNVIALAPLLSIPGEVHMANIEEGFLAKKFDGSYVDYQKATGKFFPKIRSKKPPDRR